MTKGDPQQLRHFRSERSDRGQESSVGCVVPAGRKLSITATVINEFRCESYQGKRPLGTHTTASSLGEIDMIPGAARLALRRRRKAMIAFGLSATLALSVLGIQSASASTRSRLALSLNPDRSNAVRLDGSTVKG